ncbi:MAG: anti-sigma-factor antagonist [Candidatus Angelobacter sp.]|nr:anti-sigma-factor antagonist [Candidatus Angelobacter sp.]
MSFTVESHENQGVTVVACKGRLILGDELGVLRDTVKALIPQTHQIVLDLGEVAYIDSSGLGTLVGLYTTGKAAGCDIKLARLNKRVKDLLQITKLLTVFEVYDEEEKAVASWRKAA